MPLYMSTFGYKPEVWAGLVKSPENREKAVSQILEEAGCELRGLWYAFSVEAPRSSTALSRFQQRATIVHGLRGESFGEQPLTAHRLVRRGACSPSTHGSAPAGSGSSGNASGSSSSTWTGLLVSVS